MSASEIAKRIGSTGAASGLFRSRFQSQSRIAIRSSRNAALKNARKNRSRCNGLSRSQATVVASTKSMRRIFFAFPLKSGWANETTKTNIGNILNRCRRAVPAKGDMPQGTRRLAQARHFAAHPEDRDANIIAARNGGARQRSLASRRRFCAVAVSRTSSLSSPADGTGRA